MQYTTATLDYLLLITFTNQFDFLFLTVRLVNWMKMPAVIIQMT